MIWYFLLLEEKQASFCMKVYIVWFQINLCDKNWLRQVESLYFFRLWLYVYFVLSLIKLGTASSSLGVLGCCLRVKGYQYPMKQGISVMNKNLFLSRDRLTNICCVFDMLLKDKICYRFFSIPMSRRNLETIFNSTKQNYFTYIKEYRCYINWFFLLWNESIW